MLEETTPLQFYVLLEQGLYLQSSERLATFRENKLIAAWHGSMQSKSEFSKFNRMIGKMDAAYARAIGEDSTVSDEEKIVSVVRSDGK